MRTLGVISATVLKSQPKQIFCWVVVVARISWQSSIFQTVEVRGSNERIYIHLLTVNCIEKAKIKKGRELVKCRSIWQAKGIEPSAAFSLPNLFCFLFEAKICFKDAEEGIGRRRLKQKKQQQKSHFVAIQDQQFSFSSKMGFEQRLRRRHLNENHCSAFHCSQCWRLTLEADSVQQSFVRCWNNYSQRRWWQTASANR